MAYEVSIIKCDSYDDEKVRNAVESSLAQLGGLESIIKEGDRVLIKLNLLSSKPPDAAVTTHPAVVRAVVEMGQELGATVIVGDSPGGGSTASSYKSLLQKTGIQEVVDETGCECVRFDEVTVDVSSNKAKIFKKLTLAKVITEADVIIGLPKLKTHSLTYYTGAVKLLYGYIPGMFKPEYHLHTARDVNLFAGLLLDLHDMYTPTISIMDAIVGMEGAGPSNGNPRKIGLILASKSCTAIDYVAVTIAGFDPMMVPTVKIANERGTGPNSLTEITIFGEKLEPLIMKDFKKSTTIWLSRAPSFMTNILKTIIAVKPRIDAFKCKKCGECFRDCPPHAIKFTKGSAPVIDYNKCMRCYCCQELCPEGAIDISVPLVRKILKR
ncbi:MAG TPA: DUF362 domain-containing protein [Candidatus Acidoferrales bacterium]|nr:DUF362 domain-containing protein [Candidatus Acidoferrales bacterium]